MSTADALRKLRAARPTKAPAGPVEPVTPAAPAPRGPPLDWAVALVESPAALVSHLDD